MNQIEIGKFIAECRKKNNLTQEQLAEAIGVSRKSVSRWENGSTMPDYALLDSLCKELGITINELLSGKKLKSDEYQKKLEENIILLNEKTNQKINKILKKYIVFPFIIICLILISFFVFLKIKDYRDNKKSYIPISNVNYEVCEFRPNTDESQVIIKSKTKDGSKSILDIKNTNNGEIVVRNFKYDKWKNNSNDEINFARVTTTYRPKKIYYDDTLIWDGNESLKECSESKGLTFTYEVNKIKYIEDNNTYNVTLKKYDDKKLYDVVINSNLAQNIKEGKTYEFNFNYSMQTFLRKKDTLDVFQNLELISVNETNKIGIEQINDELY